MKKKYLNFILVTTLICTNSVAQPVIEAQKTVGGSTDEYLTSMDITADGGSVAGGYSLSNISGEKTDSSRGAEDYWIVKSDRFGKKLLDKTIGGRGKDILTALQQTNDRGYILGGYSFSGISGEKTESSRGNSDYWVVKLDKQGNIQWDKTIGGNKADRLHGIQQTKDGGYILGGTSFSDKSGEKSEETTICDFWIVKLDYAGNIQWDKTIGADGEDYLKFITQAKDGGYLLGGTSSSNKSGDKTENSRGSIDYWIVKTDASGTIQWDKTIGGADSDYCRSIHETIDGGYIVSGNSYSNISGEKTQNSRGSSDYWIVKLDSLRSIQWDKTIGGNDEDGFREGPNTLDITADEGYILGGYSFSNRSGEKTENSRGDADYWVVKLDRLGNIQWDKTIGANIDDVLSCIKEINKNNFLLGGYSNSGISFDKTEMSRGGYDYWFIYLNYTRLGIITAIR